MSYSKKDLVNFRINKAKETFQDAKLLLDAERWDSAANRLYYASFYMISAYLAKREIYSARPPQVIFDFLFSRPAALRSLADALASPTFRALQAEKIGASNFHLL